MSPGPAIRLTRRPTRPWPRRSGRCAGWISSGSRSALTESLALLGDTLGFTPPARTPAVNVQAQLELKALRPTPASPREPMTEAIEAELAALTRLDIMLYRSAERRLARLRPGTGAEIDA